MAEPIIQLGSNVELDEDADGNAILRNTNTGTEVELEAFINIVGGGLGSGTDRVPGTSFFDALDAQTIAAGTLDVDTLAAAATVGDDDKLFFGTDDDWSLRYDATAGAFVLRDETAGSDVATFDDGAAAISFARSIGTDASPIPGTSHFEGVKAGDGAVTNAPTATDDVARLDEINSHDHSDPDETVVPAGGLDLPSVVVNRPERLPMAALEAGESYEIPVRVADGETLNVHRWGAYDVSDGSVPTGLDVELVDGGDTVQAAENTANTQDAVNPVASHTNSSGTVSIFKVRAANDTGAAIDTPGVGAHFGYVVV